MARKPFVIAASLSAFTLSAACGNDLESRQEAANELQPSERFVESAEEPRRTPAPVAEAEPVAEEEPAEEDEEMIVDAAPDDLIDDAQGFAAEPMDDAQGFDPTPSGPGPVEN